MEFITGVLIIGAISLAIGGLYFRYNEPESGEPMFSETSDEDPRPWEDPETEELLITEDDIEDYKVEFDDEDIEEQSDPTPSRLHDMELEDVKGIGPVKANHLRTNDIDNPVDLYYLNNNVLNNISGFGKGVISTIREDIGQFPNEVEDSK